MTIIANIRRERGRLYFVDGAGELRSMLPGGRSSAAVGKRIKRKPHHLYWVDKKGAVHERERKGKRA